MQGKNIQFEVIRVNYDTDDTVGGAVLDQSLCITGLRGRIQGSLVDDDLAMANPGLETVRMLTVTMQPGNQNIKERDYFRLTSPTNHPYYNKDMRIIKVIHSNFLPSDPRDYMILQVTRLEESHTIQ